MNINIYAKYKTVAFGIAVVSLSWATGMVAATQPYWLILAVIFLPVFLAFSWVRPEFGIVGVMGLLCGIAPTWLVPQIPFAGGQIQASELAFFALLLIVTLRSTFRARPSMHGTHPYMWPIGFLLLLAIISLVNALFFFQNNLKDILYEARIFIYWMLIPVVAEVIDSRQRLDRFLTAFLSLGIALSAMVCIQSFTGITLLSVRSAAGQLSTANSIYADVVRSSLGQGIYVIIFSLFLLVARYLLKVAQTIILAPLILVLIAGILATFGRGVWIASIIGSLIVGNLIGQKSTIKIVVTGTALVILAAVTLSVSRPQMLNALVDRVISIDANVAEQDESLVWRQVEREYAYKKLLQYPVFGIGLGGEYQPLRNRQMKSEQTRYIHNGYLYLALKLGLISVIIPFWVSWLMYINGRRLMRGANATHHAIVAAVVAAFMLPNITSFTQPEWMDHPGVAFMAIMIGLMVALDNLCTVGVSQNME